MLILPGGNALSDFRINKLVTSLQTHVAEITGITTRYVHYVQFKDEQADAARAKLETILGYGTPAKDVSNPDSQLIVIPRPGTISPWSSKATDILHNSGLLNVERVERGLTYLFEITNGNALEQN